MSKNDFSSIEDLSMELQDKFSSEGQDAIIPIEIPSTENRNEDLSEEYYPYDVSLKTTLKKARKSQECNISDQESEEFFSFKCDYSDIYKLIIYFEETGLMEHSQLALAFLKKSLNENNLSDQYEKYLSMLRDDLRGFGIIEKYLSNPDVSNVMINSYDKIFVNYRGKRVLADEHFSSADHFESTVKRRLPKEYSEKEVFEYGNFKAIVLSMPIYDGYFLSFKRKYGYNHSDHLEFSAEQVKTIKESISSNKRIAICHELSGMQRLFVEGFSDVMSDQNLIAEISTGEPFVLDESIQFYIENFSEFNSCLHDIMSAGFDRVLVYDILPDYILPEIFTDSCIVFIRSKLNRKTLDILKDTFDLIIGFSDNGLGGEQIETIFKISDERVSKLY